jgi:hypothetical protein
MCYERFTVIGGSENICPGAAGWTTLLYSNTDNSLLKKSGEAVKTNAGLWSMLGLYIHLCYSQRYFLWRETPGRSSRSSFSEGCIPEPCSGIFFHGIGFTRSGVSCYPTTLPSKNVAYFVQFRKKETSPLSDRTLDHCMRSGTYLFTTLALAIAHKFNDISLTHTSHFTRSPKIFQELKSAHSKWQASGCRKELLYLWEV